MHEVAGRSGPAQGNGNEVALADFGTVDVNVHHRIPFGVESAFEVEYAVHPIPGARRDIAELAAPPAVVDARVDAEHRIALNEEIEARSAIGLVDVARAEQEPPIGAGKAVDAEGHRIGGVLQIFHAVFARGVAAVVQHVPLREGDALLRPFRPADGGEVKSVRAVLKHGLRGRKVIGHCGKDVHNFLHHRDLCMRCNAVRIGDVRNRAFDERVAARFDHLLPTHRALADALVGHRDVDERRRRKVLHDFFVGGVFGNTHAFGQIRFRRDGRRGQIRRRELPCLFMGGNFVRRHREAVNLHVGEFALESFVEVAPGAIAADSKAHIAVFEVPIGGNVEAVRSGDAVDVHDDLAAELSRERNAVFGARHDVLFDFIAPVSALRTVPDAVRGEPERIQPVVAALRQREPAVFGGLPIVPAKPGYRSARPLVCVGNHLKQKGKAREFFRNVLRFARARQRNFTVKSRLPVCDRDRAGADLGQIVVPHRVLSRIGRVVKLVPYERVDHRLRRACPKSEHTQPQRRKHKRQSEK